jgi:uncharacterized protein (DUF1800 family)
LNSAGEKLYFSGRLGLSQGVINAQVAHAFNRFGLGARPDDSIPNNVNTWLTAQLTGTDPLSNAAPTVAQGLNLARKALNEGQGKQAAQQKLMKFFQKEQEAAILAAVTTPTPFRERLVWFWANHFAVQAGSDATYGTAGAFVRDAIRPYVLDTFENMLLAVITHPAMICSLNNDVSMGPQSPEALSKGKGGINENLARETMELFTIGIGSGFTQSDVDALSYIFTGWTISYTQPNVGFVIDSDMHQPGSQLLLGVTYPGTIFDGNAALQYLGTQADTYTMIATELVTHFVSDTPDPNDILTVAGALSSNGGNLVAAYTALIGLSNAWVPQTKLRTPFDFAVAAARSVAAPLSVTNDVSQDLNGLGQPIWQPPFPNGWSDLAADWSSASQMTLRTNWTNDFCNHFKTVDPNATANTALGQLISQATIDMMARVTSTHDKLTILYCSPDFQRR